jgi:hypothetical protein
MEAKKRIKLIDEAGEIEEILMEEGSEKELEEINDSIDPLDNVSEEEEEEEDDDDDDDSEVSELQFRVRRRGDSANILDFTGSPNGIIPARSLFQLKVFFSG